MRTRLENLINHKTKLATSLRAVSATCSQTILAKPSNCLQPLSAKSNCVTVPNSSVSDGAATRSPAASAATPASGLLSSGVTATQAGQRGACAVGAARSACDASVGRLTHCSASWSRASLGPRREGIETTGKALLCEKQVPRAIGPDDRNSICLDDSAFAAGALPKI